MSIDLNKLSAEELRALVLKMQAAPQARLTVKVKPETGTICVYGLQRFPVSLYASQWRRVFDAKAAIEANYAAADKITDANKAAKAA
jgi:hypothetical protein